MGKVKELEILLRNKEEEEKKNKGEEIKVMFVICQMFRFTVFFAFTRRHYVSLGAILVDFTVLSSRLHRNS